MIRPQNDISLRNSGNQACSDVKNDCRIRWYHKGYRFVESKCTIVESNPSHTFCDHDEKEVIISIPSVGGVCMMSSKWRDEQHPSFINFISCFLNENSFRLNIVRIAPDFILNCGGLSLAFMFVMSYDCQNPGPIFSRAEKLKTQFEHLYVVVILPTKEQNDSFVRSYFRYGMAIGRPTFVSAMDLEMGFEKIVRIAHARGVCKRQDAVSKLKAEERSVQGMDVFLKVVSSIPHVETHDANALIQTIGSIEAIAKASKENILENTDISSKKAEMISRFFRDRKFFLSPRIS